MAKRRANGENTIYFDKTKNCYKGQICIGHYKNGRIKRKSVFGKNKDEVRQKLKQIEFEIMNDDYVEPSNVTIFQLANSIFEEKYQYNEIKDASYHRNRETLKRLKDIYDIPIQKLTEQQIKSFLISQLNYSQSTINKVYIVLNMVFREAEKSKIIKDNPMTEIRKPKSKKHVESVRALTVEEQSKLMRVLQTEDIKYSMQMLLSILTGMRMGEINALTVNDVNLDLGTIYVSKTISRGPKGEAYIDNAPKTKAGNRTIPLTEDVKALLQDYLRFVDSGVLFTTEEGALITTNQVNMELSRLLKKHNIIDEFVPGKVSCHSLRHTYATRCIEAGMSAKILQKLLGHTDIRVTMNTYCDAFDQFQNENIEKLNDYMQNLGLTLKEI